MKIQNVVLVLVHEYSDKYLGRWGGKTLNTTRFYGVMYWQICKIVLSITFVNVLKLNYIK